MYSSSSVVLSLARYQDVLVSSGMLQRRNASGSVQWGSAAAGALLAWWGSLQGILLCRQVTPLRWLGEHLGHCAFHVVGQVPGLASGQIRAARQHGACYLLRAESSGPQVTGHRPVQPGQMTPQLIDQPSSLFAIEAGQPPFLPRLPFRTGKQAAHDASIQGRSRRFFRQPFGGTGQQGWSGRGEGPACFT